MWQSPSLRAEPMHRADYKLSSICKKFFVCLPHRAYLVSLLFHTRQSEKTEVEITEKNPGLTILIAQNNDKNDLVTTIKTSITRAYLI